ncbi:hypothetical protein QYM36_004723 [Artemia franciscana]|uniref:Ubiquitin-like domain-containing protein n=1 Tax=Artemia franciscana TaxID=6661 RepID=A0AA88IB28_ARTSF|nr:hypothetical protein QYM36_004723 [Artemia franciscana]
MNVNIITPYQANGFRLECPESMTIKELKTKIWEEHPSHPGVEEQKLLFLGRFLSDNSTLQSSLSNVHKIDNFNIYLCPKTNSNKAGESQLFKDSKGDSVERQRRSGSSAQPGLLPQQPSIASINLYSFAFCSFCFALLAYVTIITGIRRLLGIVLVGLIVHLYQVERRRRHAIKNSSESQPNPRLQNHSEKPKEWNSSEQVEEKVGESRPLLSNLLTTATNMLFGLITSLVPD